MRNAWVSAIQNYYEQTEQYSASLLNDIAVEFIRLSSGFKHPWIQNEIWRYLAEEMGRELEKSGDDYSKHEISTNLNWPRLRVVHAREPCPDELVMSEEMEKYIQHYELAMNEEREKDIQHWIYL